MDKYTTIYNDKLNELMKDVPFGDHPVFAKFDFGEQVLNAMLYHTEQSLDISLDEYEKVCDLAAMPEFVVSNWTMTLMFIALSAVRTIAPKYSKYTLPNWIGFKRHYYDLGTQWDKIAAPYIEQAKQVAKDAAQADIDKDARMSGLKPKKSKLITLP